jgi:hypothetical protein
MRCAVPESIIYPGVGPFRYIPTAGSLLRVITQAQERQDEQNHDDQADEINQSIHAPLLNSVELEHKTAPKEESSGRQSSGPFGGEVSDGA